MLWTTHIEKILSTNPDTAPVFGGVFASDQLPVDVPYNKTLYIANTDPAHKEGEHWVLFQFNHESRTCIYFDSMGFVPLVEDFYTFIFNNANKMKENTRPLQGPRSDVCGEYCVFFGIHLCRGRSMDSILSMFDLDKRFNDLMVKDYVNYHYDVKPETEGGVQALNQCSCSFLKAWNNAVYGLKTHF